jgi:hypothetical protein
MEREMSRTDRLTALALAALTCASLGAGTAAAKPSLASSKQKAHPVIRAVADAASRLSRKKRVTTKGQPQPPQQPQQVVQAVATDYAHVVVSWASVGGASSYAVYRNGTLVGRVPTTSFTDSMLWPSTAYSYRVDAIAPIGSVLSSTTASATTPALPAGGVTPYLSGSDVWTKPVGSAPPAANSAALISYLTSHAHYPNMTLRSWGVSVAETQPGQSVFDVPCVTWSDCTLGAFGEVPIPLTAAPDPTADGFLAIYDPSAQREWDMWQAKQMPWGWQAGAGAAVSTAGDGIAPAHTASGDAANLPLLGGLIRPEEILQGHIDHALVFSIPDVSKLGHTCPATHNDGSSTDPNALQEGMRLQLDPTLNVDQLSIPDWEKTLAHAMQTYGMYLRDEGGTLGIFAEDSASRGYDAWSKVGFASDLGCAPIVGIPWARFRVVSAPC